MTFRRGARLNPSQVGDLRGRGGLGGLGGGFGGLGGGGRGGCPPIILFALMSGAFGGGDESAGVGGVTNQDGSTIAECQTGADANARDDCRIVGFVSSGFLKLVWPHLADVLRANVAMHRRIGIDARVVGPDEVAALCPGIVTSDIMAAAYEPRSGYADPTGTAAGFIAAARRHGARFAQGRWTTGLVLEGERVAGIETDAGPVAAPVVVLAAGAWSSALAATVGLDLPVEPWRHDTAYFGVPDGKAATEVPVVIDLANGVYFRPEGSELLLVGLESQNETGSSPDRPLLGLHEGSIESMIAAVTARLPWMEAGDLRTAHGGQDGITPDQHMILGQSGPDGLYLQVGFSGTGFKIAPAVGAAMAELILDGRTTTADISEFGLERFATGRTIDAAHPYGLLWD